MAVIWLKARPSDVAGTNCHGSINYCIMGLMSARELRRQRHWNLPFRIHAWQEAAVMRRPRTLGGWFVWASIAFVLVPFVVATMAAFWFIFLRCGPTYYSPGFTESKFASLREG